MSTALEPLAAGQQLNQAEFHARYEETPPGLKFELIDGVVYMASALHKPHGHRHLRIGGWISVYAMNTPGVEEYDNASTVLSDFSEVQPDVCLIIRPDRGGQTRDLDQMIAGGPELVVEVAASSRRLDLGPKLRAYEGAGVLEYIVLAVEPFEVFWHVRRDGRFERVETSGDGLLRSTAFPGLWLDPAALAAGDGAALLAALGRGIATPEHTAFVARLAEFREGNERGQA